MTVLQVFKIIYCCGLILSNYYPFYKALFLSLSICLCFMVFPKVGAAAVLSEVVYLRGSLVSKIKLTAPLVLLNQNALGTEFKVLCLKKPLL